MANYTGLFSSNSDNWSTPEHRYWHYKHLEEKEKKER